MGDPEIDTAASTGSADPYADFDAYMFSLLKDISAAEGDTTASPNALKRVLDQHITAAKHNIKNYVEKNSTPPSNTKGTGARASPAKVGGPVGNTQQQRHAKMYPTHPADCQCWLFTGEDLTSKPKVQLSGDEVYVRLQTISKILNSSSTSDIKADNVCDAINQFAELIAATRTDYSTIRGPLRGQGNPSSGKPASPAPHATSPMAKRPPPPADLDVGPPDCISSHHQAKDMWVTIAKRLLTRLTHAMELHARTREQAELRRHAVRMLCRLLPQQTQDIWDRYVQIRRSSMQIHDPSLVTEFSRDRLFYLGRDILANVQQDAPLLQVEFRRLAPLKDLLDQLYLSMYTQFLPRTLAAASSSLQDRIEVLQCAVDFRHQLHTIFDTEFPLVEHPRLISGLKNFTGFLRQNLQTHIQSSVTKALAQESHSLRAVPIDANLSPTAASTGPAQTAADSHTSILASTRHSDYSHLPAPKQGCSALITVISRLESLLPLIVIPECIDYIPAYTVAIHDSVNQVVDHYENRWLPQSAAEHNTPQLHVLLGSALHLQTRLVILQDILRDLPFSHAKELSSVLARSARLVKIALQAIINEHVTVITTTVFADLDHVQWHDTHSWKEDAQCSTGILAYNMYLCGLFADLSALLSPETVMLILHTIIDQTLSALVARYMFISPSRKRVPQFNADIRYIIAIVRSFRGPADDVDHRDGKTDSPSNGRSRQDSDSDRVVTVTPPAPLSDKLLAMLASVLFFITADPRETKTWLEGVLPAHNPYYPVSEMATADAAEKAFSAETIPKQLTQSAVWNVQPIDYYNPSPDYNVARDAHNIGASSAAEVGFDYIVKSPLDLANIVHPQCILTPLDVLNAIRRQYVWQKDVFPPLTDDEKKASEAVVPLMARFKSAFHLTQA